MKVTIEVHVTCTDFLRGIPQYTINLTRNLLLRNIFEYGLAFFDLNGARGNIKYVRHHFGDLSPRLYECQDMKYSDAISFSAFSNRNYSDFIGSQEDVLHIPYCARIPDNVNKPLVVTCHDLIPIIPELNYPANAIFSVSLYRMQKERPIVIVDSYATKSDLLKYSIVPEENIFVTYLGFDKDNYYPQKSKEVNTAFGITDDYFVMFASVAERRKNFDKVFSAFKIFCESLDVKLVIIGEPSTESEKSLRKLALNYNISDKVISTGFVTESAKRFLLSGAIALLFPSLYEGFGLPILEAQACGCPVITSNCTACPEIAGDSAVLVDPYNVEAIADAMERVLNDSQLREDLRTKGYENIKRFSWDKCAAETEEVYRKAYDMY